VANGLKKRLEDWETDNEFEEIMICSMLDLIEKVETTVANKSVDWKIWGMFSIPIIIIILDKVL